MASTVRSAMDAAGLAPIGVVSWGKRVASSMPGIYVVALTAKSDSVDGSLPECPISIDAVEELLRVRPELLLDGVPPDANALSERVAAFWLPDETILYLGLASSSLANRVQQYYRTKLGARRPHAGGWFLKLLENLTSLHVHYAECGDPHVAEDQMLAAFCAGVSESTRRSLHDPKHPFPFANLEWPAGVRKAHGITGATEPRSPREFAERRSQAIPAGNAGAMTRLASRSASDVNAISDFIQAEMKRLGVDHVAAVEAARWLDQAGLLRDSPHRPGLPLRNLLRAGLIRGQRQEPIRRWYIDRV